MLSDHYIPKNIATDKRRLKSSILEIETPITIDIDIYIQAQERQGILIPTKIRILQIESVEVTNVPFPPEIEPAYADLQRPP